MNPPPPLKHSRAISWSLWIFGVLIIALSVVHMIAQHYQPTYDYSAWKDVSTIGVGVMVFALGMLAWGRRWSDGEQD